MGSSVSSTPCYTRQALHAGSWYSNDSDSLSRTLESYLKRVSEASSSSRPPQHTRLRALVCPHAGFSYSGPTAAYAYQALRLELDLVDCPITTILVLHPAHHVYLPGCAVSMADRIVTPVGDLIVDAELRDEILKNGDFGQMKKSMDEEEHSGEMQYPFLAHILKTRGVKVLPIMCGALSTQQEIQFGSLLSSIIARQNVLTVCSSDFCHWGSRFRYQPTSPDKSIPIHKFIESLDRRGMDLIQLQKPGAFAVYLKETDNSICGRHAIAVWMRAVEAQSTSLSVTFVKYDQSSPVEDPSESSVSYAAATAFAQ